VTTVSTAASTLSFDAAAHVYTAPDGRIVPSVTHILRDVGVSTDFETLMRLSRRRKAQIEAQRKLGSDVHAACHAFDDDDLVMESLALKLRPYVDAWSQFRKQLGLVPVVRERIVFHPQFYYCGTLDGVFSTNGRLILLDLKIGDPDDAGAQFQTAAYEAAYMAETGHVIAERWSVQLDPSLTVPFRIHNYSARSRSWEDWTKFQAFLITYHEQAGRRSRAA
jgi:hypothetical protein